MVSTAPFFRRPVREAFAAAAAAGFESVEVMVTRDLDTQRADGLGAATQAYDLRIEAIHAPFLALNRMVFSSDPIAKVIRSVSLARDLGVPIVIVHPPYRWQHRYAAWLRDALPQVQRQAGITVAVENMYPVRGVGLHGYHSPHDAPRYPDLVLDTSHAGVTGIDLASVAAQHADRLRHIHLSDNHGKGWDSHALIGQGALEIAPFLDALAGEGFSGGISLELNLTPWLDDHAALRDVLIQQRRTCVSLLPSLV